MRNTLGYVPSATSTSAVMLSNGGVGTVASSRSSNVKARSTNPLFVSGSPSAPQDFKLQAASYAMLLGTSVPVFSDFFRLSRPQNGVIDLGAMERP